MDKDTLIALLEERQDDESFQNAKLFLEAALAEGEDARLMLDYGYIHECRGRASIREAIRWYERSLELDPTNEKARHQLIAARASLRETHAAVELYKRRLAESPEDLVEYRCLAHAYLAAGEHEEAGSVVDAGLALAPDDASLLGYRGSVLETRGCEDDALTAWQRAFERESDHVDPLYSRAFLLERLGRHEEAAAEWEAIIDWLLERGYEIEAEWPKRERARLRLEIGGPA